MSTRNTWTYTIAVLKKYVIALLIGWILIFSWLKMPLLIEEYRQGIDASTERKNAVAIHDLYMSLTFKDIVDYSRLYPPADTVPPSSVSSWISEYAVLRPIVWVRWSEALECGRIVDGKPKEFAFFAAGAITGKLMAEKSDFQKHPWIMRHYRSPEYESESPSRVVRYPRYESDCRIRSVMVLHPEIKALKGIGHPHDHTKVQVLYSETVHVRSESREE